MFLFVYGTLRRAAAHPMHDLFAETARWVGEASIAGKLFSLGEYPGLVPGTDATERVWGEVYALRQPARILPQLDAYEDYFPDDEAASLYLRRPMPVCLLPDNQFIEAWVYVYNKPTTGLPLVVSGDWLRA